MKYRKAAVFCETGRYRMIGISTGKRAVGEWLGGYIDNEGKRFIDAKTQTLWYIQCPESVVIKGDTHETS